MQAQTKKSRVHPARLLVWICLFALFIWLSSANLPADFNIGGGGDWNCIDYVREGTLYGGQPYCSQGPVIYYLFYGLEAVFGSSHPLALLWLMILSTNAIVYILLGRILKETGVYHPELYSLMYLLTVYRVMNDPPSVLANCLFIIGFYALYYTKWRFRGLASGVAFALGAYTKYTIMVPGALILGYYLLKETTTVRFKKNLPQVKFKFKRETVYEVGAALAAPIVATILLLYIYPNLVGYTLTAQTDQLSRDYLGGLSALAEQRPVNAAVALVIIVSLAWAVRAGFFSGDTLVYPLSQAIIIPYGLMFFLWRGNIAFGTNYLLPLYPLLIISYMIVWSRSRRVFALLFLVTLVFPSVFGSPLFDATRSIFDSSKMEAQRTVEWGMHYIPPQEGYTLLEGEEQYWRDYFVRYNMSIDPNRVFYIPIGERGYPGGEDAAWAPKVREEVNITSKHNQPYDELTGEENRIRDDIIAGKYSLIIESPPAWAVTARIVGTLRGKIDDYCPVYIPNFQYNGEGNYYALLIFKDQGQCRDVREKVREYYFNTDRFCPIGGSAPLVILDTLLKNNIRGNPPHTCTPDQSYNYGPAERNKVWPADVVLTLVLYPLTYYLLGYTYRRLEKSRKSA